MNSDASVGFGAAPLPADESLRLATLRRYAILDTPPEDCFDRITRLAARYFDVPIALVSLVDEGRQWFKSRCGLDVSETSREVAFCAHAILQPDVMVVPDAKLDARFVENPLVIGGPGLRFYAGAPLVSANGTKIGTLCVADKAPRADLTARDRAFLQDLAAIVVDELEMRAASGNVMAEVETRIATQCQLTDTQHQLAHLATFPEENPEPVFEISDTGELTYANRICREAFPDLASEGLGHPLLAPFGRELAALRGGEIEWLQVEVATSQRIHQLSLTYKAGQKLTRGYAYDITTRKQAEDKLRENEAQLRTITDNLPVLIAYIDSNRRYQFINETGRAWYARPHEEIIGKRTNELLSSESIETLFPRAAAALSGESVSFHVELTYPDGVTRNVEANYLPHRDASGEVAGMFALVVDVTERRSVEAQLTQAQKMESIGQLTGGIAHDFNNLLTIILGNLQLAARGAGENERLLKQLANARGGAERAAELTKQLLAFSRKQALETASVDAKQAVIELETLLRRTLGEQVQVATKLTEGLWPIEVDPHQLGNALLNLAINARDAMPEGGTLTIETGNVDLDETYCAAHPYVSPGPFVVIAVSDSGTGMSKEVQEKVFEPFFTTKETGKGTGLGLSMVFGFAKQSGGHVTVYSEEGIGTTFKLYFPRGEEAAGTESEAETAVTQEWNDITVLVVEDEAGVREIAIGMLEELGFEVLLAEDGPSALGVLEDHTDIDLLFTDVVMAGDMRGPELAEKACKLRPGLKVLFASGFTEAAAGANGILAKDALLLDKPYNLTTLAEKVRAALSGKVKNPPQGPMNCTGMLKASAPNFNSEGDIR